MLRVLEKATEQEVPAGADAADRIGRAPATVTLREERVAAAVIRMSEPESTVAPKNTYRSTGFSGCVRGAAATGKASR
jgi:hypothetical protein